MRRGVVTEALCSCAQRLEPEFEPQRVDSLELLLAGTGATAGRWVGRHRSVTCLDLSCRQAAFFVMTPTRHIVFVPGLFGFARLAGYEYFEHLEREFAAQSGPGTRCAFVAVPSPPTASIVTRARVLAETVAKACGHDEAPIHIVAHSTGGLDARLLLSPSLTLPWPSDLPDWRSRVTTLITLNTPHAGTPLAQFFSTVSGTHMLQAISLLTVTTLHFGRVPLTALAALVGAIERIDDVLGFHSRLLDRSTELVLRFLGDEQRVEVRAWLERMAEDRGGVYQLAPEAIALFNAAVGDSPGVRYGCVATAAPPPSPLRTLLRVRSPYSALSSGLYTTLHVIAGRSQQPFSCPLPTRDVAAQIGKATGLELGLETSDGIVPTLSMLHGRLLWSGAADHLDVLGHFNGGKHSAHTDWLTSGAGFTSADFHRLVRSMAAFMDGDAT